MFALHNNTHSMKFIKCNYDAWDQAEERCNSNVNPLLVHDNSHYRTVRKGVDYSKDELDLQLDFTSINFNIGI